MENEANNQVRAVARALHIIQSFSFERKELSLRDISKLTALPKATVYRLLQTLEDHNVVVFDQKTEQYHLGYEAIRIGVIAQSSNSLESVAHETMRKIMLQTKQTANLYVKDGNERVCVAQITGSQYIWCYSYLGARLPLYLGAGKILLAFSDDEFIRDYLENQALTRVTENTIVEPNALRQELAHIRQKGYSISIGERNDVSASVAAPLFDYTGKCIACLTISGPAASFDDDAISSYLEVLIPAAKFVSEKLGWRRGSESDPGNISMENSITWTTPTIGSTARNADEKQG